MEPEKNLRESIKKGTLAGYPMVGVKATLYDGSYHPVDSSEMSFKMAASIAYKNGIPKASPILLEPVLSVSVSVPDTNMGDIMGEINKRRGRVLGMNPGEDNMQIVEAEAPVSEMSDFSVYLRQRLLREEAVMLLLLPDMSLYLSILQQRLWKKEKMRINKKSFYPQFLKL